MPGIEILAHAKNIDPGESALRLFLQKQVSRQDCGSFVPREGAARKLTLLLVLWRGTTRPVSFIMFWV